MEKTISPVVRPRLPQALPRLIETLRFSMGPAWVFLISAEAIASDVGLGYRMHELRPWVNYLLVSRLAFPRVEEITDIRHRHHLDDFHGQHRPKDQLSRGQRHLWDYPPAALRWNPLLRLKFFARTIRDRLRE